MSMLDVLRYRLRVLFRRDAWQREVDEEIEFHLSLEEMHQRHADRAGRSGPSPRARARRRFGNVTHHREEIRQMSGSGWFDAVRRDLTFAWRSLRNVPGFTAVAVLTLGVGIGANTAIFSAVDAMLLRPLPFPEPDRLMQVSTIIPARHGEPAREGLYWSVPKFAAFRAAQTVFQDQALYTDRQAFVRVDGGLERDYTEVVGARYLPTLGVQPILGRNFSADEDRAPGAPKVVILGHRLWQRLFSADPAAIGRTLDLNGEPHSIIGVLPDGFRGLTGRAEALTPVMAEPAADVTEPWSHSFRMVARLRPGVTPEAALAAAAAAGAQVDRVYPDSRNSTAHWGATARLLDATRVDPIVRRSLLVLLGAVALVLLIACANVANLFLVRAAGRRREIAVRLAIGAGRGRLIRQLLTESLLLAAGGGLAGIAVAWGGVKLLATVNPAEALEVQQMTGLGMVDFASIRLDPAALGFAAALVILTGLLFGLVPAIQSSHPSLTEGLKTGAAAPSGRAIRGLSSRNLLAIAEIAIAIVLLAGSGLMLRSLRKLLGVETGFQADRVLTMRLIGREGFARDSLPGFYDELLERLGALPGVEAAGLADCPPLEGGCNGTIIALRDRPPADPGTEPSVGVHWVSPGWMATMRIPLVRGRFFSPADRVGRRKVVLVNEAAARRFWPGQDPIGKPVSVGQGGFWPDTAYVAGVVGNVRFGTLDSLPKPDAYLSYYQSPRGRMMVFLRTAGDPLPLAKPAIAAIHQISPDLPVYDVRTMDARVALAAAQARFSASLLALFAIVALALAAIGIYGVISFGVTQRTREIGIRTALGAVRSDVVRLVVGQGIALAAVGTAAGVVIALGTTRILGSLLYDVAPSDPATFASILAVMAVAAVLASWIPARRAARVPPVEALRSE